MEAIIKGPKPNLVWKVANSVEISSFPSINMLEGSACNALPNIADLRVVKGTAQVLNATTVSVTRMPASFAAFLKTTEQKLNHIFFQ